MTVCGTGGNNISTVDGITGVILPPAQVIVEKLAEQVEFSHLSQTLQERINTIAVLQNGLTQVNSTVATETGILAQELLALRNDMTNTVAYIDTQTNVSIEQRQAMVTSINTLMAQWGNSIAALQEQSTILADDVGGLLAEKVIKVDLNGNVAGYGLSARVDVTGQFNSDFQVRADTFSIAPPNVNSATTPVNPYNGMVWVDTSVTPHVTKWFNKPEGAWQTTPIKGAVPFIVKTTPETLDGITVEPGIYIDSAYISRLNANQIDTRGLTIRDSAGNIILSAGNTGDGGDLSTGGTTSHADSTTRLVDNILTLNSDKDDNTAAVVFDRTTGGAATISWDGNKIACDKTFVPAALGLGQLISSTEPTNPFPGLIWIDPAA